MWISQENENQGRQEDCQPPPPLWTQKTDRLGSSKPVRHPFPKSARVRYRSHFRNILKSGNRLVSNWIAIDYRLGRSSKPRLGITVSKRHGKAHDRNRFKRIVREAFRELYPQLPVSLEANISPRRSSPDLSKKIILNEILQFLKKL